MCTCVITSGPIFDEASQYISPDFHVICADGGVDFALRNGIKFDSVYGDFDSISGEGKQYIEEHRDELTVKTFKVDKDMTDTELILRDIPDDEDILLLCPLKGRIDHVIANINLAMILHCRNKSITISDGRTDIIPMAGNEQISFRLVSEEDKVISLIPLSDEEGVSGVTTEGLYFELRDGSLDFGSTLGIHNRAKEGVDRVSISMKKGKMIVVIADEE